MSSECGNTGANGIYSYHYTASCSTGMEGLLLPKLRVTCSKKQKMFIGSLYLSKIGIQVYKKKEQSREQNMQRNNRFKALSDEINQRHMNRQWEIITATEGGKQ